MPTPLALRTANPRPLPKIATRFRCWPRVAAATPTFVPPLSMIFVRSFNADRLVVNFSVLRLRMARANPPVTRKLFYCQHVERGFQSCHKRGRLSREMFIDRQPSADGSAPCSVRLYRRVVGENNDNSRQCFSARARFAASSRAEFENSGDLPIFLRPRALRR